MNQLKRQVLYVFLYLIPALFGLLTSANGQQKKSEFLYVGTFSDRASKGIYVFDFDRDSGKLLDVQAVSHKDSPSFLEVHPTRKVLYAVYREGIDRHDKAGTIVAYKIDSASGKLTMLNEMSTYGADPCHVSIHPGGKLAFVSNYNGGNIAVYALDDKGLLKDTTMVLQHHGSSINPARQKEPHMHSAIPSSDGRYVYASDLGTDKIMIYRVKGQKLVPAREAFQKSTPGAGPRHFAMHPTGRYAYSIEELSSTVAAYRLNRKTGALIAIQRIPTLPKDSLQIANSTADIHVSPDGRFLYASNRGHDSLVIYGIDQTTGKLIYIGHQKTLGGHPRNFFIDQQNQFVFVANRDQDNVVVFRRNMETGALEYTGEQVEVPAAVCVRLLEM